MTYAVQVATDADIPSWLEIVREVAPAFGWSPAEPNEDDLIRR